MPPNTTNPALPTLAPNRFSSGRSHFSVEAIFLLLFGLISRSLFALLYIQTHTVSWIYSKGIEMGFVATSILQGEGLGSPLGGHTGPTALFAPIYPYFLAAIFRLTGNYSRLSVITVIGIQIAISLVNLWLIVRIAERLAGRSAAFCVGMIWCFAPAVLWMPTYTWDTTFTTCLLTGMLALVLEFHDALSRKRLLCVTVYGGFVSLVNPALLFAVLAMVAWLAWQMPMKRKQQLLLSVATVILVYSPWPMRNALVMHRFIPLRTNMGLELWMGNHAGATGHLEVPMYPAFNADEFGEYKRVGEYKYDRDKIRETETYIAANPGTFADLTVRRFIRFWLGSGSLDSPLMLALGTCLTTALGLFGIVLLVKRKQAATFMPFLLTFMLYPLPYYITHAELRYRLVLDPLLTALSAVSLAFVVEGVRSHRGTCQPQDIVIREVSA